MDQLLEIHSVPIIIKCTVNREPIEKTDLTADVEFSENNNVVELKSRSISVDINSLMKKSSQNDTDSFESNTDKNDNQQLDVSASAMFTRDGEISVDYKKILNQTASHQVSEPKNGFDLEQLSIQYEMDKATFDAKVSNKSALQFTPADIQFTIEQQPDVIIKYIGGPIYVPPSADPDYEPEVDIKA